MALPFPIVASQTDAKSPVDDALMDAIRQDLDYLQANLAVVGAYDYQFKFNGFLASLSSGSYNRIDGALISKDQTFQNFTIYLEKPGTGGTLTVDVRRYTKPDTKITGIARQFSSAINSIARTGSSVNTQSISRATAQINTQTITKFKTDLNVQSIVAVDIASNLWRYNLNTQPDADWVVGDSVTAASCSTGGNNGLFVVVDKNVDGGNNIVVTNASGAAQAGIAGTLSLMAFRYAITNPAATPAFTAGETAHFNGHTSAFNDGDLLLYAVNSGGNNLVVKNSVGVTQGLAAGTIDTNRFIFAFGSAAPSDYVVGELAHTLAHTTPGNNGDFAVKAVNSGGSNVHLYIPTGGATQGGIAGTVDTNRWTFFFSSDPAAQVTAGDTVIVASATSAGNNGELPVKQVDRSTADNVVVYNPSGVAQAGAFGTLVSKLMLVKFATDQSATITTASRIGIFGTISSTVDGDFTVSQVNRGGGANFNAVISIGAAGLEAVGAIGRVVEESKSIFDTLPSIIIPPSTNGFAATHMQVSVNAVLNATQKTVPAGTLVAMDLVSVPGGDAKNVVGQLT